MNETNIWKKCLFNKHEKKTNGLLRRTKFKSKKKIFISDDLKANLITNWIKNNEESDATNSIDFESFDNSNQDNDSLQIENLQRLAAMKNLIFLDLDNFNRFFQHLQFDLPDQTYIFAFQGPNNQWKPPEKVSIYENLIMKNNFHLMRQSGSRHDAADFALVLTFGKLHGLLPKSITFTIVSGDKGFIEIIHQLQKSDRKINLFNPHQVSFESFNQILH